MRSILLVLAAASLCAGRTRPEDLSEKIDQSFEGLQPVDDATFYRRVHLDLIGRLPRAEEIREFLKKPDRAGVVDRLLESPEAARYWADRWLRILITWDFRETDPFVVDFQSLHGWFEKTWTEKWGYDRLFTALVSAEGEKYEKPETNYLVRYTDPKMPPVEVASRVTRIFLGTQIQCAQCHDHPYEKWSQKDFWGMAAFFGGLRSRTRQTFDGMKTKLVQNEPVETKVTTIMEENWKATPKFLDGRAPAQGTKPRAEFAKYALTMEGRRFAKAFVNREWARLMGRPLVEPVDNFTESKPLLDALAEDFENNGYDIRRLLRAILNSKAYQSKAGPARKLKAQGPIEFLNNFEYALEIHVFFEQLYKQFRENKDLPEQYRQPVVFRVYLTQFVAALLTPGGKAPEDAEYTGSVRLALRLMNSKDLQGLMSAQWGHLKRTLEKYSEPADRIEEIFLTLLSRTPDDEERQRYLRYVAKKKGDSKAYEDIYWVLINSPDFYFNH